MSRAASLPEFFCLVNDDFHTEGIRSIYPIADLIGAAHEILL